MSTRQTTPGSSSGVVILTQQNNSKKRALSEGDIDGNNVIHQKKAKKGGDMDEATPITIANNKDKRKRKKKKRKSSIVVPASVEPEVVRSKSKLRSVTAISPILTSDAKPNVNAEMPTEVSCIPDMNDKQDTSSGTNQSHVDKGKGKVKESPGELQSPVASTSIESPEAQIARLTKELESQTLLLQKHKTHLNQIQQSLTCQICLDLLYKPFALAPCGHIACHGCLVQWFTTSGTDNPPSRHERDGAAIFRKKTCPICRTVVIERPVELWGVKSMVGAMVRSELVELPVPPPASGDDIPTQGPNGNPDPWRHIFRPVRSRNNFNFFGPEMPEGDTGPRGGLEEMGMLDVEDGSIYRCIDCMHEIWDGTCTGCHRVYPGHQAGNDSESVLSDEEDGGAFLGMLGRHRRRERLLRGVLEMFAREQLGLGDDSESDLESDFFDEDDEEEEEDDDDDMVGGPYGWHGNAPNLNGLGVDFGLLNLPFLPVNMGFHSPGLSDNENEEVGVARIDEEVDEEGYESSFIDDDGAEEDRRGVQDLFDSDASSLTSEGDNDDSQSAPPPRRVAGRTRRRVGSSTFIVSDEDEGTAPGDSARVTGRSFRLRGRGINRRSSSGRQEPIRRPVIVDSDDGPPSEAQVGRRNRRTVVVFDSDEELEEERQRRYLNEDNTGSEGTSESGHSEIELASDDDDEREVSEEDDSIPGPSSRLRRLMNEGSGSGSGSSDESHEDPW